MKVVLQRVNKAAVWVDDQVVGACKKGWLILVGFKSGDKKQDLEYMLVPECYLEPLDYIVNWTRSSTKVRKSDQNTALHVAAKYGNRTIVELLLKLGWSTKLKNAKGMTPGDMARSATLAGASQQAAKLFHINVILIH